ncbi:MAG: toll/interleukin-1 receptor domain-containing protein [Clostridia bacterium]|nr:toll/interleukin-1 receptor domain-containing protein [Clostridia bacterium]
MPGAGGRTPEKIASRIREADYVTVLLSARSVKSEWVLDEVEYAKSSGKISGGHPAGQCSLPRTLPAAAAIDGKLNIKKRI